MFRKAYYRNILSADVYFHTMKAYPHPPRKYVDYSKIIVDSLRLVWKHKFLWFFGLFAGGASSFGGYNGNFSSDFGGSDNGNGQSSTPREITDWVNAHWQLLILLIAAAIIVGLLLWLWSIVCRGAVIGSVRDLRSDRPISFSSAFARGRESFWRLLLFDLFLILIFLGLGIIFSALIFFVILLAAAAGTAGIVILSMLGLWLLTFFGFGLGYLACCTIWFLPIIFFGILFNFANRAVILEGGRPVAALKRSWYLIMNNLSQSLIMFLISVGLSIGASIALVLAVGLTAIPTIIAWVIAYNAGWTMATIVIASALALIPLAVLILTVAVMNTYFTSYWTIGYDKLSGNEPADVPAPPRKTSPRQPDRPQP